MTHIPAPADRVRGCLLGGGVGDALGAGVEFLSLSQIREQFGFLGVADYVPAYGRVGAITDDTQMTLFTAEGLIRAWGRFADRGICHPPSVVHHAYLRWLLTQGERPKNKHIDIERDGWLFSNRGLHKRRAPGNTCLSALREAEERGRPTVAHNMSKGCGGVMRVAPVGLFAAVIGDDKAVFENATEFAALTHGHPTGSLSAGYLAVVIAALMRGEPLIRALEAADAVLCQHDKSDEVRRAVDLARKLAGEAHASPEQLEALGGGWTAEEALAIALYCAMRARNFTEGVLMAVNHSGDSDSTGSLTGNLLGILFGVEAIPRHWLDKLELRDVIDRLATDLDAVCRHSVQFEEIREAYPPN
jgi:ADP-ribosylglycohydrolase